MFEKEANYIKARKESKDKITKVISAWSAREETIHDEGFQKGAEFGYNKANEWNRVDEGKYPNKEQLGESFIVAFAFNEKTQEYYSFDCAEYIDKGKFCTHTNNDDNIIAWKEIELPKEIKEND